MSIQNLCNICWAHNDATAACCPDCIKFIQFPFPPERGGLFLFLKNIVQYIVPISKRRDSGISRTRTSSPSGVAFPSTGIGWWAPSLHELYYVIKEYKIKFCTSESSRLTRLTRLTQTHAYVLSQITLTTTLQRPRSPPQNMAATLVYWPVKARGTQHSTCVH